MEKCRDRHQPGILIAHHVGMVFGWLPLIQVAALTISHNQGDYVVELDCRLDAPGRPLYAFYDHPWKRGHGSPADPLTQTASH